MNDDLELLSYGPWPGACLCKCANNHPGEPGCAIRGDGDDVCHNCREAIVAHRALLGGDQ